MNIKSTVKTTGWMLGLWCVLSSSAWAVIEIQSFSNEIQQQQYDTHIQTLRCVVCQNQNLAESNAKLAKDMRHLIAEQVRAGKSDTEIVDYLVLRYGDFVRYEPAFQSKTWLLWLGPFGMLLLALWWAQQWRVHLPGDEQCGAKS